ncbi:hypothetical protein L7E55_14495 [Pelotomaculum isophthalicicum JI]|uniref:Uncharacterized protein n=1 Tax=Pelotomaculum isophthalicicum JI TaxID=947010 RepID=A0A9X4JWK6_9FIRM|nr:hypothetical protein [Pelotomaculum isophthalicicum]MDF9409552.1 hypothetical protein [Pelotomaculum isophthalicicum JI]
MFPLHVALKAPGGCKAWIEERPIWEIPEVDDSIKYRNKAMVEQGLESPIMERCLCWDKPQKRGKNIPLTFYEDVLDLAKNADNTRAIIDFWGEYGPLIRGNMASVKKVKGILWFFNMIVELWQACVNKHDDVIRKYLGAKPLLPELEDFCAGFNDTPKEQYLFDVNGKIYMSAFSQGYFEHEYCLVLKQSIPDINSEGVYKYITQVLSRNINKRLSNARSVSLHLNIDGSYTRLTPRTLLDAALISLFLATPQARPCACGCGNPAAPGSKYYKDSCRKKTSRWNNEAGVVKDRCLSFYRKKKGQGIINEEEFQKIKSRVDRLIKNADEGMVKKLSDFCKRNGFPVWTPRENYKAPWK